MPSHRLHPRTGRCPAASGAVVTCGRRAGVPQRTGDLVASECFRRPGNHPERTRSADRPQVTFDRVAWAGDRWSPASRTARRARAAVTHVVVRHVERGEAEAGDVRRAEVPDDAARRQGPHQPVRLGCRSAICAARRSSSGGVTTDTSGTSQSTTPANRPATVSDAVRAGRPEPLVHRSAASRASIDSIGGVPVRIRSIPARAGTGVHRERLSCPFQPGRRSATRRGAAAPRTRTPAPRARR